MNLAARSLRGTWIPYGALLLRPHPSVLPRPLLLGGLSQRMPLTTTAPPPATDTSNTAPKPPSGKIRVLRPPTMPNRKDNRSYGGLVAIAICIGVGVFLVQHTEKRDKRMDEARRAYLKKQSEELDAKAAAEGSRHEKWQVTVTQPGNGSVYPQTGQYVTVKYTGYLKGGQIFDSTDMHGGRPFTFRLGEGDVIRGWEDGIRTMSLGERARIAIPPAYAYGSYGVGATIPPNAHLLFDIELLAINDTDPNAPPTAADQAKK